MHILEPEAFALHERLIAATRPVGQARLTTVLMIDDHRLPWLLLVPRVEGVEEMHHLSPDLRTALIEEIAACTKGLEAAFDPIRINVADIGNRVAQMHIHIVARKADDVFWPKVVWSREREGHSDAQAARAMLERLRHACREMAGFIAATTDAHVPGV